MLILNHKTEEFTIPPGIFEVEDMNKTLDELVEINVSFDVIKIRSRLKTNGILRFDEKSSFDAILGLTPHPD